MLLQMALSCFYLCLSSILLYVWTTSLSIQLLMDIQVVSVLAAVNSAAMNILVHISF